MARPLSPRCSSMRQGLGEIIPCGRPQGHTGPCRKAPAPKAAVKGAPGGPRSFPAVSARKRKADQRDKAHARHVTNTYGIPGRQYWLIYAFQGNRCAICMRATGRSKRLAVDHSHACIQDHDPKRGCKECVRGLLCSGCNKFLGWIRDDPKAGERIARYLTDPPYRQLRRKWAKDGIPE